MQITASPTKLSPTLPKVPQTGHALPYRLDIDGLRSLAIIPILLFHAGVTALRGGFVGVDVFFVISGFLITRILMTDLENGTYSIVKFYQRRAKRILPALFVVLLCVMLAAPLLRIPSDIASVYRSIAAASAFSSNIYFWSQVSYFARAAESEPLLHTWSLGVEEQFYFFYPLLVATIMRRSPRYLKHILIGIAVMSFSGGLYIQTHSPTTDFYLLPTRSWELILGGLVALGVYPQVTNGRLRLLLALSGVGGLTLSILFLVSRFPFPTPFALAPCVATAMLIAYGEHTVTGRVLSNAVMRWIGKVSYSLYLWHWPIIVFYRERYGFTLTFLDTVTVLGASIIAAVLSYYLVEKVLTRRLRHLNAKQTVLVGLTGATAMTALALAMAAATPSLFRISPEAARIAGFLDYKAGKFLQDPLISLRDRCFVESKTQSIDKAFCLTPVRDKRNIMLLGDSHAAMYAASLVRIFPKFHFLQATAAGCPPIVGNSALTMEQCKTIMDDVLLKKAGDGSFHTIIMASRWRVGQTSALAKTIILLRSKGLDVVVIGPVNEYDGALPKLLARAIEGGDQHAVEKFEVKSTELVDRLIGHTARGAGARYYSVYEHVCARKHCALMSPENEPLHFDYGHLTESGARYALREFTF